MKHFCLTLILSAFVTAAFAQEHSNPARATEYFIVIYTTGSGWNKSKPANEQTHFKEHTEHLSELRKANKIDIGGRYSDIGMLLLKAKGEDEAREMITSDVAIKNKLFKAEIFPFDPFYKGCVR
jgi:hypothetical protein